MAAHGPGRRVTRAFSRTQRFGGHIADAVVLNNRQDRHGRQLLPDRSTSGHISSRAEPPSCRGPPSIARQRRCTIAAAPGEGPVAHKCKEGSDGEIISTDPAVLDDLGDRVAVCTSELDVIETYLDRALRDLRASGMTAPDREKA